MIAAIDQHIADAARAHFAEGDFLRAGGHLLSWAGTTEFVQWLPGGTLLTSTAQATLQ
jgi:hypothetical protein